MLILSSTTLLQLGFNSLLDKNSVEDLRRMFSLFQRVDAAEKIKVAYNSYIKVVLYLTIKLVGERGH